VVQCTLLLLEVIGIPSHLLMIIVGRHGFFSQRKFEVYEYFKSFKSLVERESDFPLKTLRTDRGGEYVSREFEVFLKENDNRYQLTARYSLNKSVLPRGKIGKRCSK